MTQDLRDLLDDVVARPPAEPHRVACVVRRAERSRLRFRVVRGTAGVLAVLVVVGVGVAGFRAEQNPNRVVDPQSVAQQGVVGPVVHARDATPAVAGRDYDEFASYTARDLDTGNDRLYTSTSRTGEVLVSDPVRRDPGNELSEYDRYGLIAPGSSHVTWLPLPPGATFDPDSAPSGPNVTDVTADTVVWTAAPTAHTWKVDLYHRGDGTWTALTIPIDRLTKGRPVEWLETYAALADGRIWFAQERASEVHYLWSVAADGTGGDIRDEGKVGDWAVDDTHLVWTSRHNTRAATYSVRDLTRGTTRTFATRSGARCNQLGLELAGERIALTEYCGTHHRVRDDREHVVSLTGRQVVTVRGDGFEEAALGDDFLGVYSFGATSKQAGTYVYDFSTQQLRRVSAGAAHYGGTLSAGHRTLTWAVPVDGGKGQTMHAATWR